MNTREITQAYRLKQWSDLVKQCRTSGQIISVWCKENGINEKSYYYWQRKVRDANSVSIKSSLTPHFVPIEIELPEEKLVDHNCRDASVSPIPAIILTSESFTVAISNDASASLIESILRAMKNVR